MYLRFYFSSSQVYVYLWICFPFFRCSNPKEPKSCSRMPRSGSAYIARVLHQLLPECSGESHQDVTYLESHVFNDFSYFCIRQDKFNQLLSLLPDLREMAQRGEDFLYFKHMQGHAPHHTLLMEMLLAKRNDGVSKLKIQYLFRWHGWIY